MANKTQLREASAALQAAMDEIGKIAAEHPSLMVYTKDSDGKASYGESFSSLFDTAQTRVAFFRRQLNKIEDIMPKGKRRSSKGDK